MLRHDLLNTSMNIIAAFEAERLYYSALDCAGVLIKVATNIKIKNK